MEHGYTQPECTVSCLGCGRPVGACHSAVCECVATARTQRAPRQHLVNNTSAAEHDLQLSACATPPDSLCSPMDSLHASKEAISPRNSRHTFAEALSHNLTVAEQVEESPPFEALKRGSYCTLHTHYTAYSCQTPLTNSENSNSPSSASSTLFVTRNRTLGPWQAFQHRHSHDASLWLGCGAAWPCSVGISSRGAQQQQLQLGAVKNGGAVETAHTWSAP